MNIAFDLDNTLISSNFPQEECRWLRRMFLKERLRRGTKWLFRHLRSRGHRVWIYTTSCRSEKYISRLFHAHGLNLDGIVNLDRHNLKTPPCSKYPPAFGIDLLIDDSPGVEREGRTHGFSVIIVSPDNPDWAEKLLDEIDHLKPQNARIDEKNDSAQTVRPLQIENYLTDDENSLLYPWVLDKVSGTVRNQLPDSQTYADFLIFARRTDMYDCAAINHTGEVIVYHYQIGNRSFMEILREFSTMAEFLSYAEAECNDYKQRK